MKRLLALLLLAFHLGAHGAQTASEIMSNAVAFSSYSDRALSMAHVVLLGQLLYGTLPTPSAVMTSAAGFQALSDRDLQIAQVSLLNTLSGFGQSGNIYVKTNGSNATGQRNTTNPFATLESAISNAQPYDIIYLGPGTFGVSNDTTQIPVGVKIIGTGRTVTKVEHDFAGTWLDLTNNVVLQDFTFTTVATVLNDANHHIFFGKVKAGGATNFTLVNVDAIGTSDILGCANGSASLIGSFTNCNWTSQWDTFALNNGYINLIFGGCNLSWKSGTTYANTPTPPIQVSSANSMVRVYGGSILVTNTATPAAVTIYCATCTGDAGSQSAVLELHGVHLERWQNLTNNPVTVFADAGTSPEAEIDLYEMSVNTNVAGLTLDANNIVTHPMPSVVADYGNVASFNSANITNSGTVSVGGSFKGAGSGITNFVNAVFAKTGNYTVTAAESGVVYDNNGAGGAVTNTLPPATVGLNYSLDVVAAQNFAFKANGTDTIRNAASVSAAGGLAFSSTIGTQIGIRCDVAGKWVLYMAIGTITIQ